MRYLVTGGCGFIGSHIAEELLKEGATVRVLDNLSSGYLHNIADLDVEFVEGDVRDPDTVAAAATGMDGIFHQAALVSVPASVERPRDNHDINATGTLNVLLAARDAGVTRVVAASSAAIYGDEPTLPKREQMTPQPLTPYAIGKITLEYYQSVFARLYGVETVSLRYFNVFGPRQDPGSPYSGVISKFVEVMKAGDHPMVFGDGEQTRDFVYVKDVVQANLSAMKGRSVGAGDVINVGTGSRISLLQLIDTLAEILDRTAVPRFAEARAGDIKHSVADISRAGEALGYAPATSFEQGLRHLVASVS
ncbi:MAG: UDP-glucose 4-epimerase [Myxococcota bacterium]|jgi:UDP-glucose 4-epimerase